jgi:DNA-directed RNA polymerase specialized sigma24 family protein
VIDRFGQIEPTVLFAADGYLYGGQRFDCLARLHERRRAAVTLYPEGFGTAEVAQAMGWTLKQAENLIYRGVADLRHCLAGGEP